MNAKRERCTPADAIPPLPLWRSKSGGWGCIDVRRDQLRGVVET